LQTRGQRIAARRAEIPRYRRNQLALARDVGVSRTTLSDWERDAVVPSAEHVTKLARALGVSVEWIESGDDSGSPRVKALIDRSPAGIRRFDLHVGLGSWISMAIDEAEEHNFTRGELFGLLRQIQIRAEEAERTINKLYSEVRRLSGQQDGGSGS
jgi:transcriptional regulator with XRE-family HTH domain